MTAPDVFDAEAAVAEVAASGVRRVKCGIALRAWVVATAEWSTSWELNFLGGMAGRLIGDLSFTDKQLGQLRASVAAIVTRRAAHRARVDAWLDRPKAATSAPPPQATLPARPVRWTPPGKKGPR